MPTAEVRKQISMFVSLSDWKAIRSEAARRVIPMTELCRQWMRADLNHLKRRLASEEHTS
jgi:hypothetical protein